MQSVTLKDDIIKGYEVTGDGEKAADKKAGRYRKDFTYEVSDEEEDDDEDISEGDDKQYDSDYTWNTWQQRRGYLKYSPKSDEDEEITIDLEEPISDSNSNHNSEFPYEVLSTDSIRKYMSDCIKEVNIVVQMPATTTRMLLNYFKWDKERLIERFYEIDDQNKLFKEACIMSPFIDAKRKRNISSNQIVEMNCTICCCDYSIKDMYALECDHMFCKTCWQGYLTTKIMDEGMGQTIACAQHKCDILVDDETVLKILKEKRVLLKYQHLISNSFVESNKMLRWCPKPDCGYVIKASYFDKQPVTCKCTHVFCFACGENWHDPVNCAWLRKWIKKCDDDSETSNWIAANTKECPQCNSTIEKDGGCNHMICKKCNHDFCWVCLGKWEPHGSSWYSCNRYDESEAKKARDSQEKSRSALQRYLFYCNRYMNHMQSLKFENKLVDNIQNKMESMQEQNMSWIEVQFLRKAVDVLCQCRQTLMYTYVFAFYLNKNNQSIIFEDNQKDLENSTEILSEYLERDIDMNKGAMTDIKQKVQDKLRYCESRRKVLLDHVHEGYEKDNWIYWE